MHRGPPFPRDPSAFRRGQRLSVAPGWGVGSSLMMSRNLFPR